MVTWHCSLTQLRDILIDLYPTEADARRMATTSQLETSRIDFANKAINVWQGILEEAEKQGRTEAIIGLAVQEYGRNATLQATIAAYRHWVATEAISVPAGTDVASSAAPGSIPRALHQLPAPPADFTGRQAELQQLKQAIGQGHALICGLRGLGGIGKTALALMLARDLANDYPDAQFFLDLRGTAGPSKPATQVGWGLAEADWQLRPYGQEQPARQGALSSSEAMAHIIRSYYPEAPLPDDDAALQALYRSVLQNQRALILLDNVLDKDQVEPLLPPAGCLLLVTSRQRFTLPLLYHLNLETLPEEDAIMLLQTIAPRLAEDRETTRELAHLCGCLPLALRVVASHLTEKENVSLSGFAESLRADRGSLSEVETCLKLSDDLLSEEARQRWYTLAIFPADFDEPAVAAVWDMDYRAAEDALGDLLRYSLLEYQERKDRYRLHDLVRIYTAGRLSAAAAEAARARHAQHYELVLCVANQLYRRGRDGIRRGLALFDLERANCEAGQAWSAQAFARLQAEAEGGKVARLCSDYAYDSADISFLRSSPREHIHNLESALAAARWLGDRRAEGRHLDNLGSAYFSLGEFRRAIECHEQALSISREAGDSALEGIALGNLGNAYDSLGQVRRAIEFHQQALGIARAGGDRREESNTLSSLGNAYHNLGEFCRAIEYQEQALSIAREIGDRYREGILLSSLGRATHFLGEFRRAIAYHDAALVIVREIGDRQREGRILGSLGAAYQFLGEFSRAIDYQDRALGIAREIGDRQREARILCNLGLANGFLGEFQRAMEFYEKMLPIAREIGDRRGEAGGLNNLAYVCVEQGECQRAMGLLEQCLAICRETEDPTTEAYALDTMGSAHLGLDQPQQAIELYERALGIFRRLGDRHGEQSTLDNLGLAYLRLKDPERAMRLFQQALEIAHQIEERAEEADILWHMAQALDFLGDRFGALGHAERALAAMEQIGTRRADVVRQRLAQWRAAAGTVAPPDGHGPPAPPHTYPG